MSSLWQAAADLVIEPNVDGFAYDGFERAPDLVRAGEEAARKAMPEIRKWLVAEPLIATAAPTRAAHGSGPQTVELAGD
jgi:hypothetical protein